MGHATPLLDKPAPGWKRDLPGPNQQPLVSLDPNWLMTPPNHFDHVYLELARSTLRVRGVLACAGITIFSMTTALAWFLIHVIFFDGNFYLFGPGLAGLATAIVGICLGIYYLRMDLEMPRSEPIRFNRLRRKVYVYRFHHNGLRPFSRSAWGVRPEVYSWDDLHAEACSAYGPLGTGGLIENITLTVLKPGTREVLDRFIFAHDIDHGEEYWAMAQLFMQQGPQALPTFFHSPRDWNNEDARFNLARRFAPKVQWPADMDLESRTAP